jgi:hypothetical protein
MTRLMSIKSKYNFSHRCYDDIIDLISDILQANHKLPRGMYQSKKMLVELGMKYEKIDYCSNNCMLFWKRMQT